MPRTLPCFVCLKPLESALPEDIDANQPYAGTAFFTNGHYGSTAFDPFNDSFLEINICDACLFHRESLILFYANSGGIISQPVPWDREGDYNA